MAEHKKASAASTCANHLPPSFSTIAHIITIVRAPYNAGKNFTQKKPPPSHCISKELKAMKGGTDKYPAVR